MDIALMLLGVTLFPVAGLALLLWLTRLEETLPSDVRSALRAASPPPVLAVPVRRPEPVTPVVLREPAEQVPRPVELAPRPVELVETPRAATPARPSAPEVQAAG